MADQLRGQIRYLIKTQDEGEAAARKYYEKYQFWKAKGNEKEAEFNWMSYKTWSNEIRRLGE